MLLAAAALGVLTCYLLTTCLGAASRIDDAVGNIPLIDSYGLLAVDIRRNDGSLQVGYLANLGDVDCAVDNDILWLTTNGWLPSRPNGTCSAEFAKVASEIGNISKIYPESKNRSTEFVDAITRTWALTAVSKIQIFTENGTQLFEACAHTINTGSGPRTSSAKPRMPRALPDATSGAWSYPWYDCTRREWIATYSLAAKSVERGEERLTVEAEVSLQRACEVNQCSPPGTGLLGGTHKCDRSRTTCEHIRGAGFTTGSYNCQCMLCEECPLINGSIAEALYHQDLRGLSRGIRSEYSSLFESACSVKESRNATASDEKLGKALAISSGVCIGLCILLMVAIVVHKDSKAINAAKWMILEMTLIGAACLYGTVVVRYFPPEAWSCILQMWLRELGFTCAYGALNIKTYKVLAEFQTRKARRVHVRDKDLVKYWLLIIGVAAFFVAAWTAINMNYETDQGLSLTKVTATQNGQTFSVCLPSGWDVVTELMELCFILSGLYMCYRIRLAPSVFWESKCIAAILIIEFLVSGTYYITRHCLLLSLHPDWMYLLSFCHVQLTMTMLLTLLLAPKLWYIYHPPKKGTVWSKEGPHADLLGYSLNNERLNGGGDAADIADISLKEMEPDEIWRELRRVYTQLQVLKVKVMCYENPHIHEKKQHKIRKHLYSRISRVAHHKSCKKDTLGSAAGATTSSGAAGEDDFAGSHEQELLANELAQATAIAVRWNKAEMT